MGDRLGILRVVSSSFSPVIVLFFYEISNSKRSIFLLYSCSRPYRLENTGSRPITAVKLDWAELILGWETA